MRKSYARPVDLVSTVEIAEMLGVTRQRVSQLMRADTFPAPTADLAVGRVWLRDEIEAWAAATGRDVQGASS